MKYLKLNWSMLIPLFVIIISFISSCGKWGWQPISSDHESTLNVFAVIIVGDSISERSCYINVHQSLDLEQDEEINAGYDTTWYGPDKQNDYFVTEVTKSAYIVEDATVFITDGTDTTYFYYLPPQFEYDYGWIYKAMYFDTLNTFIPKPNQEYKLHVTASDGRSVTSTITTPSVPKIYENQVPDTLNNKLTYKIPFNSPIDNKHLRIVMKPMSDWDWTCGIPQEYLIQDVQDTVWTSEIVNCSNYFDSFHTSDTSNVYIALEAMDNNFYEYFVKNQDEVEYINFLAGIEGNSGFSAGIEGGYGVFGAIAVDQIERVYIP